MPYVRTITLYLIGLASRHLAANAPVAWDDLLTLPGATRELLALATTLMQLRRDHEKRRNARENLRPGRPLPTSDCAGGRVVRTQRPSERRAAPRPGSTQGASTRTPS